MKATEKMKEYYITGMDEVPNTVDPDNFVFVIDNSSSMDEHQFGVEEALNAYKSKLSSLDEATAISVARFDFNHECLDSMFTNITRMTTSYSADGGTDLYGAIVKTAKFSIKTYESLIEKGYDPRMTYIILSDGRHEHFSSGYSASDAKKEVEKAAAMGITMVFVDFGSSNGKIPRELGFQTVYSCENSSDALQQVFQAITTSCVRQSQSKIVDPENWMW